MSQQAITYRWVVTLELAFRATDLAFCSPSLCQGATMAINTNALIKYYIAGR